MYGRFENTFGSRGFRSNLSSGDELVLSLLIPNLAPENQLSLEQLPTLTIERPDKSSITLSPTEKEVFSEPFTGTNYLRLLSTSEPAQTGVYHFTINGNHRGRFTVSTGTIEQFGTPVENVIDRYSSLNRVLAWYSDSPHQSIGQLARDTPIVSRFKHYWILIPCILGVIAVSAVILARIRTDR